MKTYSLSFAASLEHKPEHPERTARKSAEGHLNFDVIFCVFPNRPAMLKTVEIQERAGTRNRWRAVQPAAMENYTR